MYDLSKKFNEFYSNKVVLPKKETNRLREKKKINIQRLKDGLVEYSEENKKYYKVAETIEQGSVAMATVTQNEKNDYDIDVAIIFDENNLGDLGPGAVKNMVANALERKCGTLKNPPEIKTNCVRITYADNYHLDFAIYRRIKNDDGSYNYEHAGSKWTSRDPRAINRWFKDEVIKNGANVRKAVRLSKMFCKSRDKWVMPGGLIQSVLCCEKIQEYERIDELFYYTLVEIKNRLEYDSDVKNPTDQSQTLLPNQAHKDEVQNYKNRIESYLEKLSPLFEEDCTEKEAYDTWYEFFNHDFWIYTENETENRSLNECLFEGNDEEEYIDNIVPVEISTYYTVKIDCDLWSEENKNNVLKLSKLNYLGLKVPIDRYMKFYIASINVPAPYQVYWKVKNNGIEAVRQNSERGEILRIKDNPSVMAEYSCFAGNHYVECYIIKSGICIAMDRIEVPIV